MHNLTLGGATGPIILNMKTLTYCEAGAQGLSQIQNSALFEKPA